MASMCDLMESIDFSLMERERSTQAPRAPLSAKAVRHSFPIPLPAPVTTQVFPSSENAGRVMSVLRGTVAGLAARRKFRSRGTLTNMIEEDIALGYAKQDTIESSR